MLRVVTLNVWNRQGPWDRRAPLIRRELAALAPDLVGLQEVLAFGGGSQAHDLVDGLGYHVAFASSWSIGGGLEFGNAIVSRHPIASARVVPLPIGEQEEIGRSLGVALVETPHGVVPFFNTHLDWPFHHGAQRLAQVLRIVDEIDAVVRELPAALPPILVGDLNAEPDSDEVRFLSGLHVVEGRSTYLADCWRAVGNAGPGHTYARRNPYALTVREPSRRIDYVFVRGPDKAFRGEPLSARVCFDQPDGDVWPSDHFGVVAELSTSEGA